MNSKTLIELVKIIGIGWFMLTMMKKVEDWLGITDEKKDKQQKAEEDKQLREDIDEKWLTYSKTTYVNMANKYYSAIQLNGLTEKEENTYPIWRMLRTNSDFLQFQLAHGDRLYGFPFRERMNLIQATQYYFDKEQQDKVNEILRVRDIKYQV